MGLIDNCLLFLLVEVGHTAVLHASEHGHKELLELLVDKYKCPPRSQLDVCAMGDSLAKPYIFNVNVLSIYHNMATLMGVSTSYYTLSLPYCVYCSRPEGAKCPRASAVNKAILQREHVVSGLSQNSRLENTPYV